MPRDFFHLGYRVKQQAEGGDTAEVLLYGQIINDMPEAWKWSKEDKSAANFDKAIKEVREKGATKLLLRINSPGGVCTEAVAMRAILAGAGFDEINIRIEGMCASAATDIATLPGAHVAICEGSEYMIHNPWCFAMGNASDMENTAERLRAIEAVSRGFYAKKSGQSDEQIKTWMDAEKWFTAEEAVEYGFADELITAEAQSETPAAACATSREMETMRALYKAVPENIPIRQEPAAGGMPEPAERFLEREGGRDFIISPEQRQKIRDYIRQIVSNEAPVAGDSTEIHHEEDNSMDIKDINVDQLRAENPALLEQIQQAAVAAERQRQDDIDALTDPGYEDLAAQAKANGTSPEEFVRQLVAAKKQKGPDFMAARQKETAPAKNIAGGAAGDDKDTEEQEIKQYAASMAKYAKEYAGNADGDMF